MCRLRSRVPSLIPLLWMKLTKSQRANRGEEHIPDSAWAPFKSEMDWRVAKWAIQEGIGHNIFDRFLSIPGLSYSNSRGLFKIVDSLPSRIEWNSKRLIFPDRQDEEHFVQYRDPCDAVAALLGDPAFSEHIVYKPSRIFTDKDKKTRIYQEMWTGKWWNAVQDRLPEGHCVAPVIIASDKTQLSQFTGNKSSYPVYLTLGNIPRSIRRRPSQHACILIGYLSVAKIRKAGLTAAERRARAQTLFHESLRLILSPLIRAGKKGMKVSCSDGWIRFVHPILACYVADYPEQCLVACAKYNTCPKCLTPSLEAADPGIPRTPQDTLKTIEELQNTTCTRAAFTKECYAQGLSGVQQPFWIGFPHTDIHRSITPDVLHQLYQGVFKHIIDWCGKMLTREELDERLRRLPPAFGVRHFKNGFSALSQISGTERKHMARILLGCLVGRLPSRALIALRALLDFIYIAQYPTHDDVTLGYLQDALDTFFENRIIFKELKIRPHFNIPKFHSLLHYAESIRFFGASDNYNTEMFERFHIDFAKEAWRASNRRDERPQMAQWLSRREKTFLFDSYLSRTAEKKTSISDENTQMQDTDKSKSKPKPEIWIAKNPQLPNVHLSAISVDHGAPDFEIALKKYINSLFQPGQRANRQEVAQGHLPFHRLDVFTGFKFLHPELGQTDGLGRSERDREDVKAQPPKGTQAARFDTVIVLYNNKAESTGVEGTRVGRLRVIFKLPQEIANRIPAWTTKPLAYVEWYTPFTRAANEQHMIPLYGCYGR
ncbi:hypothetical protein DENSPDRAFT_859985 [Dentipellis sp. KUC8613]|nr:hypothetical protein DENSPDRAFT_859985 [Dentipellis sp. KUC8613]